MNNQLNEEKVLEVLGISDFRHMTKEKVMQFTSMLNDMQPEVAIKALEQFPDFSKTLIQIATEEKQIIEKSFDGNLKSMQAYQELLQTIIDALQNQMGKDDISFEEKKYYIEKMLEIEEECSKKDSENKNFLLKVDGLLSVTLIILGGIATVALGGKMGFKLPDK